MPKCRTTDDILKTMSGDGRLMIAGCLFDYSTTVVQKLATDAENYNLT